VAAMLAVSRDQQAVPVRESPRSLDQVISQMKSGKGAGSDGVIQLRIVGQK